MRRLTATALMALALLAACSDDNDGQTVSAQGDTAVATTTTTAPAPTTTAKPATTTTTARPTTTTTAIPADQARLTIVNEYPAAIVATVNGVRYEVPKGGRRGPVGVKPRSVDGNDTITINRADDPTCGAGDADGYFEAGGAYTLRLYVNHPGPCGQAGHPGLAGVVDPGGKVV